MFLFKKNLFLAFALLFVLSACGGGSSAPSTSAETETASTISGTTKDTTAPTISGTTPAALATSVARNSVITATFDENIFATTFDSTSFTLDKLDAVSGVVTFDGVTNVASFTPNSELALLANYTATLSAVITDLSGNALATNYDWSFTTADGAWGEPALLELDNTGSTSSPQIAINGSGNANAVWVQSGTGSLNSIWGNSFNGTTWGIAELLELENTGEASSPQVATDSSGKAVAVWSQRDVNDHFNILAASFNGSSWGANAQVIDNAAGKASFPQIAVDRRGNAIAVWHQQAENRVTDIWANRFNGTTWGTAELIEFIPGAAFNPQIAFDENQDAIVVWRQTAGAFDNIYAIRFNALGGTWGQTEVIDREDGDASAPQIAVDISGNAIAVWQQSDGIRDSIWANRFNGTTWGTAELIETSSVSASSPQIAFNSSRFAIAVWEQQDGVFKNIWANRSNGNEWSEAELIETDDAGDAFRPQIAIDSSGNAIAVWHQNDSTRNNLWANRFGTTSFAWGAAELIETDDSGSATFPQIAIDGSGNGIAVWSQRDGSVASIWANLFK
jgi:hypothetical protein